MFSYWTLGSSNSCTTQKHWNLLIEVLMYLRETRELGIWVYSTLPVLKAYCDKDHCSESDCVSREFCIITSGGTPIAKKTAVTLSSAKPVLLSASYCGDKLLYLQCLLREIENWCEVHDYVVFTIPNCLLSSQVPPGVYHCITTISSWRR